MRMRRYNTLPGTRFTKRRITGGYSRSGSYPKRGTYVRSRIAKPVRKRPTKVRLNVVQMGAIGIEYKYLDTAYSNLGQGEDLNSPLLAAGAFASNQRIYNHSCFIAMPSANSGAQARTGNAITLKEINIQGQLSCSTYGDVRYRIMLVHDTQTNKVGGQVSQLMNNPLFYGNKPDLAAPPIYSYPVIENQKRFKIIYDTMGIARAHSAPQVIPPPIDSLSPFDPQKSIVMIPFRINKRMSTVVNFDSSTGSGITGPGTILDNSYFFVVSVEDGELVNNPLYTTEAEPFSPSVQYCTRIRFLG